ncbi:DUF2460 domain-containing protein [Tianweitania sediminis]|jgi:uncharacterized protein (TIGR02217 family)|uniref:DUF2460 domain-containing protein n=1 Tax=Tianweitania sediminis TaxID=1502156 RepID=A0A8J7UH76_9HYPH|nr:DUF2460 domain-containing protein [Tianweitania sediminis]MBP0438904.1 DUF2460 domain-containing protein [Tianweitania sediminis]HEV7416027.1 DUF2460 domain-containing protein [Tianweitania sediminis]
MQEFHDALFPTAISFGATGGPERKVEIVQLTSGREARNLRLRHSRRRYDVGTGLRALADLYAVLAFFEARRGSLHPFRFRDPFDMKSCLPDQAITPLDQPLGTPEGEPAAFQLAKTYGTGEASYVRPIRKIVAGSVRCAVDGVELREDRFAVDPATGLLTLADPVAPGAALTAGFEFHVPVRFDAEHLSLSLTAFKAGQIPSIPLIEVSL